MSERRRLVRVTGLLSALTLISRFTGLVRDAIIAALLGSGILADVFWITFELPNIARRVLGEGALSAFMIPLFAARRKESEESGWRFVNRAFNAIGALSVALTILGIAFSGFIFNMFGGYGVASSAKKRAEAAAHPVAANDPAPNAAIEFASAPAGARAASGKPPAAPQTPEAILKQADDAMARGVFLSRLMFPYLIALALASLLMGVCNSLESFAAPALRSAVNNITMIVAGGAALGLAIDPHRATVWLAVSFLVGSIIGLWMHFPYLYEHGWRWKPDWAPNDPHVRELFGMLGAGVFSTAIYQINIAIAGALAAYAGPGNKSFLVTSQRLIQFPMALTATALSTALLPRLSQFILDRDDVSLRETMGFSKRFEMILMIPATLGLMFFGEPIIEMIFQRGAWTAASTTGAYGALLFYAPGLIPQGWIRLLQPLYYARRDVKTPLRAAFVSVIVNIVFAAAFTFLTDWRQKGLALASTLAAFANYYYMVWHLRGDPTRPLSEARSGETFAKAGAAGVISIGGCWLLYRAILPAARAFIGAHAPFSADSTIARALILFPFLGLAGAAYFVAAHLMRVPESDRAVAMIMRKVRRRMASGGPNAGE